MTIERDTLFSLPTEVTNEITLRQVLARLIEQLDLIVGLRGESAAAEYTQVVIGPAYVQADVAQIAFDLKILFDRVEAIESRLVPVSG